MCWGRMGCVSWRGVDWWQLGQGKGHGGGDGVGWIKGAELPP